MMSFFSSHKVRIILAVFCSVLSVVLGFFVWIMLNASAYAMSSVLLSSLVLIVSVTVAAQVIYALKGQIFEFDGRLARQEILFAIICFQVIMQFSFGFSLYAVRQTELQNNSFDSAYGHFFRLQQMAKGSTAADYQKLDLEANMPECVEAILLVDANDTSGADLYYRFPIHNGKLLMKKSQPYFLKHLRDLALSLIMSLVISILLMIEIVILVLKYLNDIREFRNSSGEIADNRAGRPIICPSEYLRQLSFLFYFSGFLGASFIPIMARHLCGNNPNADFIAGIPYSIEAFANCIAILLATRFFRRYGWKPPYIMGAGIFIIGLALAALSPNIFAFIASRGIVGVGYGLCWMTLRNIVTLSGDRVERFSSLFSGIYAGIMCGVAFGAVLADLIGYNAVLLVSAVMSLAAAVFPMTFHNEAGAFGKNNSVVDIRLTAGDIIPFVAFLALIVIPTCVTDAFCGYLLPLYIDNLNLPTAYIGRVSLIYNLCLVYISSTILIKLIKKFIKNVLLQNALHMMFISVALFAAAYLGGLQAMIVAAMLLGSADGFGFSIQNSYVLDTKVSKKIGIARMLTYFSLFKKFGAMLGPMVLGLFIMNGFSGLGLMGFIFLVSLITCMALIIIFQKQEVQT